MGSGYLGGDPRQYPKQLAPMRLNMDLNDNPLFRIDGESHASMSSCVQILAQLGRLWADGGL
jgi:hypothetical protein